MRDRRSFIVLLLLAFVVMFNYPYSANSTECSVGSPKGVFDVSATGAATYTIEIDLPEVNTSLLPSLGIVYNSQHGNGAVGWGCDLSGLSAITRGCKDYFHDGMAKGISHNSSDAYYLDGKRLILESGIDGMAGAVYRIEGDPISRVTVMSGYAGVYFKVHMSDGIDYEYGCYTYAQQRYYTTSGGEVRTNAWYLNKKSNILGDYVNYFYNIDHLSAYLGMIAYGNSHSTLTANVFLSYEAREDTVDYYIEDAKGSLGLRLKSITSMIGTEVFRSYNLTYNTNGDLSGTRYSRLIKIEESNGNGDSVRPIMLTWNYLPGSGQNASTYDRPLPRPYRPYIFDDRRFACGDINNDGVSDIIQFSLVREPLGSGVSLLYTYAFTFLSKQYNGVWYHDDNVLPYKLPGECHPDENWLQGNGALSVADLTGDGYGELILPRTTIISGYENMQYFSLLFVKGSDIASGHSTNPLECDVRIYDSNEPPLYTMADFNNDGKCDVLTFEKDGTGGYYHCTFIYDVTQNSHSEMILPVSGNPEKMFAGDYNGDGMTDILLFHANGYKIFWNEGGLIGDCPFSSTHTTTGTNITDANHVYPGDFNGDGQVDFLLVYENDWTYYFALGTGKGTFQRVEACHLDVRDQPTSKDDNRYTIMVYDIDHDGKSDAVLVKSSYDYHGGLFGGGYEYETTEVRWLISSGTGLQVVRTLSYGDDEDGAYPCNFLLGDFNGDGNTEMMNYGKDLYTNGMPVSSLSYMRPNTEITTDTLQRQVSRSSRETDALHLYKSLYSIASSGKVTSVTDGFGNSVSVNYGPLTDESVYTAQYGSNYPVINVNPAFCVVSSTNKSNGAAGIQTEKYRYGGLRIHGLGRGLLGFASTTVDNTTTGITTTCQTSIDTLFFVPQTTTVSTSAGSMTTSTVVTNTIVSRQNGKNFFAHPSVKTETDIYGNTCTTNYAYNLSACLPSTVTTTWGNSFMFKMETYADYQLKGGRYVPGTISFTQKHEDDIDEYSSVTSITYNDYGLQSSLIEKSGTNLALNHTFSYDNAGHLLTESVSGSGVDNLITHYVYNSSKQLIQKYTSPSSTTTSYTYDTWSNLLSKTESASSSSLTTDYEYDGWGNLAKCTTPLGVETTFSREWGTSSYKKYKVSQSTPNEPWQYTWYDSQGRVVQESTVGEGGISIDNTYVYDVMGRMSRKNMSMGNLASYVQYTYDSWGRILSETSTFGLNSSYEYGSKTITTSQAERTYTKTFDDWGNIRTATDSAGTVTYQYASNGNPVTVTGVDGKTVTMTYDMVANRIGLTDPDAGTSSYVYDAAGRIVSQTDARMKTQTNTYDAFGRLISHSDDGAVTTFSYDAWGRTTCMQNTVATLAYTYDHYGRVIQETRSLTGENDITKKYTYSGPNGKQSTTAYPCGVTGIYSYDVNGYLKRYLFNGATLWLLTQKTGSKTTSALFNGSLLKEETLNSQGRLSQASVKRGQQTIQQLSYSYNSATGNLISRSGITGTPESFTYDNLDRLTKTYEDGQEIMAVSYASNGNILTKTDIGHYNYSMVHPHAVQYVDNSEGYIPSETQDIVYNAFGKVQHIEDGNYEMDFIYGPDHERWKTVLKQNGQTIRTTIYAGDYERVTENDTTRHFFYGEKGIVCIKKDGQPNNYYYACTDHLGSIVKLVDENGNVAFEATYDPWGLQSVTRNDNGFFRGYTGHEMLPEFGLINMNGRLYDPQIGRFLSPDNYVQEPYSSQSFNRYSYCMNNPLKYVDPSGELFGIDDAFLIFTLASGALMGAAHADMNGSNVWAGALKGFTSSALSLIGTAGIGQLLGHITGSIGTELLRTGLHGLNNGFISIIDGNNFGTGFLTGAMSSLAGSGAQALNFSSLGVLASTVGVGAITATCLGRNFFDGAMTGLNIGLFNHEGKVIRHHDGTLEAVDPLPEVIVRANHSLPFRIISEKPLEPIYPEFGLLFSLRLFSNFFFIPHKQIIFGQNANQQFHSFRHIDKMGLDRASVRKAVELDARMNLKKIIELKPYNGIVNVDGQKLQYTIYKINKNTYNVGRIHGIK